MIEGARLLVGTLSGQVLEADFTGLRLLHAADSNAGAVWAMEAFDLRRAGCGPRGGSILALGCEDGSVRLFRVHTHSGLTIERMSRCSGTDGRVLSLAWHAHSPILCAGTAGGTLRCWDCSPIIAEDVLARNKELKSKKEREVKSNVSVKTNASLTAIGAALPLHSSSTAEIEESEEEDEEERKDIIGSMSSAQGRDGGRGVSYTSQPLSATPRPVFRIQIDPQQVGRKGSSSSSGGKDAKPSKVTLVWCVSVLSDMTVITGDSNGDVLAWDGRLGVAAHSAPLARLEGAVLSLSACEDEPGALVTIAAGGLEGRVSIVTRTPPYFSNTDIGKSSSSSSLSSSQQQQQQRWALVSSHRSHIADVCAISVHRTSALQGGAVSVVSAASDGRLSYSSMSNQSSSSLSSPLFISSSWQGPSQLVSLSTAPVKGGGSRLACFNSSGTALQVWRVAEDVASVANAEHLLQINIPRISLSVSSTSVLPDAKAKRTLQLSSRTKTANTPPHLTALELEGDAPAEFPLNGFPSAVSISNDGLWLCYSVGGGRVPPALFSLYPSSKGTEIENVDGIRPEVVSLPTSISSIFGSKNSSSVSLLQLVSLSPSTALLVLVIGLRIYVCSCSHTVKDGQSSSECTFLYSLPVPRGISEPLTVVAGRSRKRARSSTSDSLTHLVQSKTSFPASLLRNEDTENDDAAVEDSMLHSTQSGPMSSGAVMPILISISPLIEGVVSLVLATSSRHVHVYKLSETRGSLIVTLPRLTSLPTALCFAPFSAEQHASGPLLAQQKASSSVSRSPQSNNISSSFAICAALRSGGIEFFSADSGRLLPWSPEATSLYPNSFLASCRASPVRSLIPINNCPGEFSAESSRTVPFKILAISATALTPLVYSFNSNSSTQATPLSSHRTMITCARQTLFSSGLRLAGVFNSSSITSGGGGGRDRTTGISVAVVEDKQADTVMSKQAQNVKKKKYGKV